MGMDETPRRMDKVEALRALMAKLRGDDVAVFCNGITSREGYMLQDRARSFYMLASMGHARMIGLGLAQNLRERVVVFDGDGNYLMCPGGPHCVGAPAPANFVHVVFDNRCYETTGSQASLSGRVDLVEIGRGFGYESAVRVSSQDDLSQRFDEAMASQRAELLVLDVERGEADVSRIIPLSPMELATRFREAIACPS